MWVLALVQTKNKHILIPDNFAIIQVFLPESFNQKNSRPLPDYFMLYQLKSAAAETKERFRIFI